MSDENICASKFYQRLENEHIASPVRDYHQSGKQCLCSHKDSKQLSGVTARKLFLLVDGTAPKPLFAEFHSAAMHRSGAFFSRPPGGDFLKKTRLAYQHNRKLSHNRKRHFSKSVRLAEPQPDQQSGLFKGLGILPNKQNLRFPALPRSVGFERLYIQTPSLPHSASPQLAPALDRIPGIPAEYPVSFVRLGVYSILSEYDGNGAVFGVALGRFYDGNRRHGQPAHTQRPGQIFH